MSDNQLELLRLPQAIIDSISHPRNSKTFRISNQSHNDCLFLPGEYIQGIGKDKKPYRKIYRTEEYTPQETLAMSQLKEAVANSKINLPEK